MRANLCNMVIITSTGRLTLPGWCYTTIGFRHTSQGWTLTHLPTGMAIRSVATRQLAESLAQRLDSVLPPDGTLGQQPALPALQAARDVWRQWSGEQVGSYKG